MNYNNLNTETNYNYPVFNEANHQISKKPINNDNFTLQIGDKNDLKESLLTNENHCQEYKQSGFNYVDPKQSGSYGINDLDSFNNKNNMFVQSKENQINVMGNTNCQEKPKKPLVSDNFIVQNENCSFQNNSSQQNFSNVNPSNQVKSNSVINYSFIPNNNTSSIQSISNNNYNNINNIKPIDLNSNSYNYQQQTYAVNNNHTVQRGYNYPVINNPNQNNFNNAFQSQQQQAPIQNLNNISTYQQQHSIPTNNQYTTLTSQNQVGNNVAGNINNNSSNKIISYSFNKQNNVQPQVSQISNNNQVTSQPRMQSAPISIQNNQQTQITYQQIDCSKCKTKLAYPQGSKGVFCPLCQTVTKIVKMEFIICGKCKVTLTYPSGSQYVRCQACNIVNLNPYYLKKN